MIKLDIRDMMSREIGLWAQSAGNQMPFATAKALTRSAKAGKEENCDLLGQSCIIAPTGEVVAMCSTIGDELATASCDLDRCKEIKDNVFNFALHREQQHYRLIAETKGAIEPR